MKRISIINKELLKGERIEMNRKRNRMVAFLLIACVYLLSSTRVYAIESAPAIEAESAILIDASTGAILYEKNAYAKQFPASITKIMTALLVQESCEMNEIVTFSHNAVYGIERGSSNIGIDENETLTVEECLYALMLASANEVALGLAEHVAGSVDAFVERMNEKAEELGCKSTHFVNPNGLPDEQHFTSAYDMGLIARAFFSNENLSKISGTATYHIDATPTQPDTIDIGNHNKMLPGTYYGSKYYYKDLVGGKTGYTNVARQTLVTSAKRGDIQLICVVMKDESPNQYRDSAALYDYGFEQYTSVAVDQIISASDLADQACQYAREITGKDYQVIDDTVGVLEKLLIPKGSDAALIQYHTSFDEEKAEVSFSFVLEEREIGNINVPVFPFEDFGDAAVLTAGDATVDSLDLKVDTVGENRGDWQNSFFVRLIKTIGIILLVICVAIAFFVLFILQKVRRERERIRRRKELLERRRRRLLEEQEE